MQEVVKQADGSALLTFAPASAPISGRMQTIVVHVVCSDAEVKRIKKSGRPAGLSPQLEACVMWTRPMLYAPLLLPTCQRRAIANQTGLACPGEPGKARN